MWNLQFTIIILVLIIFQFLPMEFARCSQFENHSMKQSLNLSARALSASILVSQANYTELAKSYMRDELTQVEIDKDVLLREFNDLLFKNVLDDTRYKRIKENILVKVLVYYDKFFTAGRDDKWSQPYYFTYRDGSDAVYLNTLNDTVHRCSTDGIMNYGGSIADYGLSRADKYKIIIEKVNSVISQNTSDRIARKNGLKLQIRNPALTDPQYKADMSYFNALDGVTFFAVYAENKNIIVNTREINYRNYNVVGYTLD